MALRRRWWLPATTATAALLLGSATPLAFAADPAANAGAPFTVEDGAYPNSDQVLAETGAKLIRGDGGITYTSCAGPYQIKVWARDLKLPDERMCFAAPRGAGNLTVNIPGAYRIQTYERSVNAGISINNEQKTLDVPVNTGKSFGEAGAEQSEAVLLELRVTGSSVPAPQPPTGANPLAFTGKLTIGDTRSCTAALVDALWVMTAKSCFADKPAESITVAAGAPKSKAVVTLGRADLATSGGHTSDIVELVPHADRDVVLARLALPASTITPVKLSGTAPAAGQELTVTGYGRTPTEWAPTQLHSAAYTIGTTTTAGFDITAKTPVGATLCKGDAGAPALRNENGKYTLVGITSRSWQNGCLDTSAGSGSGAYETRVSNLSSWLTAQTGRAFEILNPASGRCLNISGSGPTYPNLTPIILFDCTLGAANEKFQLTPDGLLRNPASGRCLNVSGSGPTWANGTPIVLFDCTPGAANEKFEWTADGQLRNPASGRCLNVSGSGPTWANSTPIILFDCSPDSANEKFRMVADNEIPHPVGLLRNPASGRCLNVSGSGPTWPNLTPIILFDCTPGAHNEMFQLTAEGQILNPASGRCLNISGSGPWTNGTPIILFDCTPDAANEKFEWTPDGQLRNPASGRCLNISGGGPTWGNGTPIILYDCSPDAVNEKFQLSA
ncbi:ricin-type beta-trefoil lectin domain protein [Streptomyces gardneri]|uniref:ricin-type beta-trefoil lectin domain protein n=1 Tax=Streptomyces gardneri TaxID=66892 RepID=UPI0033C2B3FC